MRRSDDDLGQFLGVKFSDVEGLVISLFYSFSFLAKLPKIFPFSQKIIRQISSSGGGVSPQVCLLVTVLMVLYTRVAS